MADETMPKVLTADVVASWGGLSCGRCKRRYSHEGICIMSPGSQYSICGCEKTMASLVSLRAVSTKLAAACRDAKQHLQPDLVEPGRTVFWKLVDAISKYESEALNDQR